MKSTFIYTFVKMAHFFRISLEDLFSQKSFGELVDPDKLNYDRLPKEKIKRVEEIIKNNARVFIDQHPDKLTEKDILTMMGFDQPSIFIKLIYGPTSLHLINVFKLSEIIVPEGDYKRLFEGTEEVITK